MDSEELDPGIIRELIRNNLVMVRGTDVAVDMVGTRAILGEAIPESLVNVPAVVPEIIRAIGEEVAARRSRAEAEILAENLTRTRGLGNAPFVDLEVEPGDDSGPLTCGYLRRRQHAAVYWHEQAGTHTVSGAIYTKYQSLNASRGLLGYPLTGEERAPDGVGRYTHFQGGSIYWTPENPGTAYELHGAIRDKWAALGWERSFLGYPVGDETQTGDGLGSSSRFQRGTIYYKRGANRAVEVHGAILGKWASLGSETSYLGYPVQDELDCKVQGSSGGRISRFERGSVVWTPWWNEANEFPDTVIRSMPVASNDPLAVGGWIEVTLTSSGRSYYRGHMHNSGAIPQEFQVATVLNFASPEGKYLYFEHKGHTGGTIAFWQDRDYDFSEGGDIAFVRENWDSVRTADMRTRFGVDLTAGDVAVLVVFGILVAPVVAGAGLLAATMASSVKACPPSASIYIDPATGRPEGEFSVPIVPDGTPCPRPQ